MFLVNKYKIQTQKFSEQELRKIIQQLEDLDYNENPVDDIEQHSPYGDGPDIGRRTEMAYNGDIDESQ